MNSKNTKNITDIIFQQNNEKKRKKNYFNYLIINYIITKILFYFKIIKEKKK